MENPPNDDLSDSTWPSCPCNEFFFRNIFYFFFTTPIPLASRSCFVFFFVNQHLVAACGSQSDTGLPFQRTRLVFVFCLFFFVFFSLVCLYLFVFFYFAFPGSTRQVAIFLLFSFLPSFFPSHAPLPPPPPPFSPSLAAPAAKKIIKNKIHRGCFFFAFFQPDMLLNLDFFWKSCWFIEFRIRMRFDSIETLQSQ